MNSIRRRTAALVALSMAALLVIGGAVLLVVLRGAIIAQFDDALTARAAALQSLTGFDGTSVELDVSREIMPRYASAANTEFFIAWTKDANGWTPLQRAATLSDDAWPPESARASARPALDVLLPGGVPGRGLLIEFVPRRDADEDHPPAPHPASAPTNHDTQSPTVRLFVAVSRAPLDRTLASIAWSIAAVGTTLLLVGTAASLWAVSRGLLPLLDLSRRVQALGPDSLATRFDPAALPNELRPIAQQLSALLARLDEAFTREKHFSAAASHELRTPIAELRMLLEVAATQPRSSEQWALTATTALAVITRAQSLCEALLRLSRSSAHNRHANPGAHADIGPILTQQAARVIRLHAADPRLIRIECPPALVAQADPALLDAIAANLLANALLHGQPTTLHPVIVSARSHASQLAINFTNPAPTLTTDDLAHLFEPFWRKDTSRHDRRGFGLGLAVPPLGTHIRDWFPHRPPVAASTTHRSRTIRSAPTRIEPFPCQHTQLRLTAHGTPVVSMVSSSAHHAVVFRVIPN